MQVPNSALGFHTLHHSNHNRMSFQPSSVKSLIKGVPNTPLGIVSLFFAITK